MQKADGDLRLSDAAHAREYNPPLSWRANPKQALRHLLYQTRSLYKKGGERW
jgi:hypothetical protein